ncbi:MAG: energy-coupling factor ABC transporter permease, partial [Oceanisphaera sp.]|nr:energy-coupling factor ABC transporter permease [Oceanisphaera sp.]
MLILSSMLVLLLAAWNLDWRAWLADKTRQHLSFGAAIALVPLWMLQAGVKDGLEVHFLGLTTMVLMLGWRMGVLMATLSLLLITLFGFEPWSDVGANWLLGVIVPLSFSYFVFLLTYSYLPRHLFVYIFVAGFFNAALTIALKMLIFAGYMVWSGQYSWQVVMDN